MRIVVLCGGTSDERAVSIRSGITVSTALQKAGHHVTMQDPGKAPLTTRLVEEFDLAFPVLHGKGGEDGTVQQQLDDIGLDYVGSRVTASALCFNKWNYREFVTDHKVTLAEGALVSQATLGKEALAKEPFVLKPYDGGSSIDTVMVRNPNHQPVQLIEHAFSHHKQLLLEQLIDGVEITVGVIGDVALPVIEIIPPKSGEFDYENKYNGASQELCPPLHVDERTQSQARTLAVRLHRICGCDDYSRTDMIVTPDNRLVVLETNTLPGMTEQSLLPKAAAVAGLSMSQLCDKLVKLALKRRARSS